MKQSKLENWAKRLYAILSCLLLALTVTVVPAFAAGDPLAAVNNLSDFSAPVSGR